MAIFKRGRVYWYHFIFNGEHIQESTKQGNPRVARQMEAAIGQPWRRARLAYGKRNRYQPLKPSKTFSWSGYARRRRMRERGNSMKLAIRGFSNSSHWPG